MKFERWIQRELCINPGLDIYWLHDLEPHFLLVFTGDQNIPTLQGFCKDYLKYTEGAKEMYTLF